jgi:hypothetical protein
MINSKYFYAHTKEGKPQSEWQPLEEHLKNVAEMARKFAVEFGSGDWGYLVGLWHDLRREKNGFLWKGFQVMESGAMLMDDDTRKSVLVAYQTRKQDEITHPYIGEKVTIGILFHIQALLLARFLRGDLDGYPAFIWK